AWPSSRGLLLRRVGGDIGSAQINRVPARDKGQPPLLDFSGAVTPSDVCSYGRCPFPGAQTKMEVGTATAGVTVSAVHLRDPLAAIGQVDRRDRADGGGTASMEQSQAKKGARLWRFVLEEIGRPPLVRAGEIQAAIAIHVGNGKAAADHRFGQPEERRDVVVAPVGAPGEKRIRVAPAQIGARPEVGPEARIVDDLIVARAERLKFWPTIDFPPDESARLYRFGHAVVVEIRQTRIPRKTAA